MYDQTHTFKVYSFMNFVASALIKIEHFFPFGKFLPIYPVLTSVTVK